MCMCKKMILAILIISIASGTKTKFQIRIIKLSTSANRAFMLGHTAAALFHTSLGFHCSAEFISSVDLLRVIPAEILCSKVKNNEIQQ